MAVMDISQKWRHRIGAQAPEFRLTPNATFLLLQDGERRFHETFGYCYIESHDRISTVSMIHHFQTSSADNATWSAIKANLDVTGASWNAGDLALAVDRVMAGRGASADVSVSVRVVATGVQLRPETALQFPSSATATETVPRGVWDEAMTRSTFAEAVPISAHLATYRSLVVPGHNWNNYEGVPMTVQARVLKLDAWLQRLERPVALFPSATQQRRFADEYASRQAAFSQIKGEQKWSPRLNVP